MKIKVLFITIIFMVSVVLSGCVDNSADEGNADADQITEKANPVNEKEDDKDKSKRIVPKEVREVREETPEQTAPVEKKVISAGSSGSGGSSSEKKSSEPDTVTITVTDDRGREITVPYPCERTVFLVENAMNSMYAVGGADNIVGIGGIWKEDLKAPFFKAVDPDFDDMVRISRNEGMVDLEALAVADPELVVLWSADPEDANTKAIEESLGVPVYGAFIDSLEDLKRQMEVFGKIIGEEERGEEVVEIMEDNIEKVTDVTDPLLPVEKPTVYWMWGDIYGTAGVDSTANDLIEMGGGVNVLDQWNNETKYVEHPLLNLETLLTLDPEVIYIWYNENLDPEDILSGETVTVGGNPVNFEDWQELSAVQNGRVYEISDPFVYDFHSPRLPLTLMHIAKDLQPEKYEDLDLAEETDDFFVDVYGVHYPGYESAEITVTDDNGREITVLYPCERAVFLVENAMNSMYAVGGADNIVGIGAVWWEEEKAPFFRAIDPNYDKKRLSEGSTQPTDETIASVNPELVFLWIADWDESAIRSKEETLGVPVYGVFIDSLDDLQRQMETFSKLIGKEEHGAEVLTIMDENMEKVTDVTGSLPAEEKPTVYWMWGDIYGTAGLGSTATDLMERAGGVNVLNNWEESTENIEHPKLNLETLLELNPDVIYMWYNEKIDPEDIIEGRTIDDVNFADWQEIEAVKNGRVYEISDPFVYDFHSPRLPLAMIHIAKDLHPDRFADLNLTEETDQFYVDVYEVHYPGFEPASGT